MHVWNGSNWHHHDVRQVELRQQFCQIVGILRLRLRR